MTNTNGSDRTTSFEAVATGLNQSQKKELRDYFRGYRR